MLVWLGFEAISPALDLRGRPYQQALASEHVGGFPQREAAHTAPIEHSSRAF